MSPVKTMTNGARMRVAITAVGLLFACDARIEVEPERSDEIPITTRSSEARELFLQGRDLADKIRQTEARALFERAVEQDPGFALAHLLLANTARSAAEFFEDLQRAVELAETVSEGERLLILGQDAASRGDPAAQRRYLTRLVELYPRDERARFALGVDHFARQEYDLAIEQYRLATELEPAFSPAYNLLGYAYRSAGRFDEAEKAFLRYIDLIPNEPNPHDSYAEFLMKQGRFEESIRSYEKALGIDAGFVPSFVGIANNQIFLGRSDEARAVLEELAAAARNEGERRQALLWTAVAFVHDGDWAAAEESCRAMLAVAEAAADWSQAAGDLALIGDLLYEAGDESGALAAYDEAQKAMERADVNRDVKEAFGRSRLYRQARVAIGGENVEAARELIDIYADAVAGRNIPSEVRRLHELQGLVALVAGDAEAAVAQLEQANQQDPRVLYELARAYRRAGDDGRAREQARVAANWNQLDVNYAYVRSRAQRLLAEL